MNHPTSRCTRPQGRRFVSINLVSSIHHFKYNPCHLGAGELLRYVKKHHLGSLKNE